ncbi:MAG: NAD-dependent epimerase/dehydratase family protein [Acidimicrobiaceae bacterium]|nr:NAD-dependent epimerase/dehydratase family protein [Ilumatobacter sp.]MCB9380786.1 NAD-dependent epimerase/dehydratase family protein [Acidimicrobiaceae bacterium]MCO5331472.1 NAD-dependent epimerase/dehydratase family protein [Ilumatobacteraceae bacterium]
MKGQRVLVSGMGGELGSLVAAQLEAEPWVGSLVGIDVDPPRRRLRMAEFHLLQPSQRERIVDVVTKFNPHVVINISVWEPDARAPLDHARTFTADATTAIIGAAAECPALESMVVRSGLEVYGRGRGSLTRPTEDSPLRPTSEYGHMLANIERTAREVGRRVGISVGKLRLAPVLGKHVPSPLGRILRQPVVPFSALADAPFAVIEDGDAARAFVRAAAHRLDEPVNIVAPGAITALQAILRGKRIPLPLFGPEWWVAARLSHVLGAPIPDHVVELMHRGRLGDGNKARELLGFTPRLTTPEVVDHLFAWESVVRVGEVREVA